MLEYSQTRPRYIERTVGQFPPNMVRRWLPATRGAHGLYRQFGLTDLARPETIMEKFDPDAYR
ncbi:hypothetical protein GCM10023187_48670 [Nibrella viscosa]|uniref:Uncharacterized protein n=1 Tax=Nibrella viscosa TaxID=1084524 RepID=A0ABP8KW31_9BACT